MLMRFLPREEGYSPMTNTAPIISLDPESYERLGGTAHICFGLHKINWP